MPSAFSYQAIDTFELQRLPRSQDKSLRAWDAADEYALAYLVESGFEFKNAARVLLLNDQFGALTAALNHCELMSWGDSYVSQQATKLNIEHNQLSLQPAFFAACDLAACDPKPQRPELIILKVPHNLSLLEQQLHSLRRLFEYWGEPCKVIAAGMVKQIHNSTTKLFSDIIGPTTTSLAKKKARLIFSEFDAELKVPACPYPSSYHQAELGLSLAHHANVFSLKSLDIGARAFIDCFDRLKGMTAKVKNLADLGCGNGVLGTVARRYFSDCQIDFYDESFAAVNSAKLNYQDAHPGDERAEFIWANCFLPNTQNRYDLILCNPPFHQQRVVGDFIAWPMIVQSHRALHTGGEFWLVGNRHLDYHKKLKRVFGNYEVLSSTNKFVVLKAVKMPS